jgi:hypothetical protein
MISLGFLIFQTQPHAAPPDDSPNWILKSNLSAARRLPSVFLVAVRLLAWLPLRPKDLDEMQELQWSEPPHEP